MGEHVPPIATFGPDLSPSGETRLSEALEAILRETPSFHVDATYNEVATAACTALQRVFPSQSCSILRRKNGALELAASQPGALTKASPSVGLERCRGLPRLLTRRSPLFLEHRARRRPPGQDHALDRRPALWMALGPEEVADLLIVLEWRPEEPPPDDRTLLVAQLFSLSSQKQR